MSEAIKLDNDVYLDSSSISYERTNLKDIFDYSKNDVVVGKWINGKKIYRKTIIVNSLPNNTTTDYNHNITGADLVWFDQAHTFIQWQDGTTSVTPYLSLVSGASVSYNPMIEIRSVNTTKFQIATGFNRSTLKAYITLLYTKTTD